MTEEHKCNKEKELSEMHTILKRLDKAIMGNGRSGMFQDFQQWKGAIKIIGFLLGAGCLTSIVIALVK